MKFFHDYRYNEIQIAGGGGIKAYPLLEPLLAAYRMKVLELFFTYFVLSLAPCFPLIQIDPPVDQIYTPCHQLPLTLSFFPRCEGIEFFPHCDTFDFSAYSKDTDFSTY